MFFGNLINWLLLLIAFTSSEPLKSTTLPIVALISDSFNINKLRKYCEEVYSSNERRFCDENSSILKKEKIKFPEDFAQLIEEGPIPNEQREYLIDGWRWHTMSVLRDLNRFSKVLSKSKQNIVKTSQDTKWFVFSHSLRSLNTNSDRESEITTQRAVINVIQRVNSCYDFVVGFNWRGLLHVEKVVFFPWLDGVLPKNDGKYKKKSRNSKFNVYNEHQAIENLWKEMDVVCRRMSNLSVAKPMNSESTNKVRERVLTDIAHLEIIVNKMILVIVKMRNLQQFVYIPIISACATKSEQEIFNRKVIQKLGLLDSQVHIVSMFEAIKDQPEEVKLFNQQIPAFARKLIPFWRKKLYLSKSRALDCSYPFK